MITFFLNAAEIYCNAIQTVIKVLHGNDEVQKASILRTLGSSNEC